MKILTFSKQFPKGHPKAGQLTYFVEKILLNLYEQKIISKSKCVELARATGIPETHPMYYIDTVKDFDSTYLKSHTIRAGNRWKVGDMASLRIWSGAPYRSKQREFAQVEIKKVWDIEIKIVYGTISIKIDGTVRNGVFGPTLAKNDGLEWIDFVNWFMIHPKKKENVFTGQIICWSDKINY